VIYREFASFFQAYLPNDRYQYGPHTHRIIDECQKTSEELENGHCRYVIISVMFRHGKSDIVSRRFPCWHLLRNPDHEIILASYNYELATSMAHEVRRLFREAGRLYDLGIEKDRATISSWQVAEHRGALHTAGIGGTITGRGAHLLILDDYLKNREEAESETMRDKVWHSFQSDLITRLAPVHAVFIVATRWHEDDLIGRIKTKNDPNSENYDPDFPVFETIEFPALNEAGDYLFPQRFNEGWYKSMRSALGTYAWNAMAQQNPTPRTGNLLQVKNVKIVDAMPEGLRWRRGWDPASTAKERCKDDPDYTVGTKTAFKGGVLYVDDVVRLQAEAPQRDKLIIETAKRDSRSVTVYIEMVAGYKDLFIGMRQILSGYAVVRPFKPGSRDKVSRAAYLEPLFEAGRVVIRRAEWNRKWLSELAAFPAGKHDDQVDSLVISSSEQVNMATHRSFS